MSIPIIDEGGSRDKRAIPLATRQGTWIRNVRRTENAPEALRDAAERWKRLLPNAILRSNTALYNCVGLVFASRRTWVGVDDLGPVLRLIFEEDGYNRLSSMADVERGDVVVYRDPQGKEIRHIGIVIEKSAVVQKADWQVTVLSKWGPWGEYVHPLRDVPSGLGEPVEFWSERRIL